MNPRALESTDATVDESPDGKCLRFTALSSDAVVVGTSPLVDNLTSWSVVLLVRADAGSLGPTPLIAKRQSSNNAHVGWDLSMADPSGNLRVRWRRSGGNLLYQTTDTPFAQRARWIWILAQADQSGAAGNKVQMWTAFPGTLPILAAVSPSDSSGAFDADAAWPLQLGSMNATTQPWRGDLALCMFFANSKLPASPTDMIKDPLAFRRRATGWWRLGHHSISRVRDESGHRLHGTATGPTPRTSIHNLWLRPAIAGRATWRPPLTFTQSAGGTLAPAAAVAPLKVAQRSLAAGLTPAGTVTRTPRVALAASVAPDGALERAPRKLLAGGLTPAGSAAGLKVAQRALAATIAPAAAVVRRAAKVLAGALAPAGTLTKGARKLLGGALTPSGAAAGLKVAQRALAATVAPAATVAGLKVAARAFAGSIAPSGTLGLAVRKLLAAALAPAAAVARQKVAQQAAGGTIAPSGTVARAIAATRAFSRTIAPAGSLTRRVAKVVGAAVLAPVAAVVVVGGVLVPVPRLVAAAVVRATVGAAARIAARVRGRADIQPDE